MEKLVETKEEEMNDETKEEEAEDEVEEESKDEENDNEHSSWKIQQSLTSYFKEKSNNNNNGEGEGEEEEEAWLPVIGSPGWKNLRRTRRQLLLEKGKKASEMSTFDEDDKKKDDDEKDDDDNYDPNSLSARLLASVAKENYDDYYDSDDSDSKNTDESMEDEKNLLLSKEVVALESLLEEQEDEIDTLEEEVHTHDVKYRQLKETFNSKRKTLRDLENKCASLKVELATSCDNESMLQLNLSQEVMVRDLDVINLTNEYNQLQIYKARLEQQKETMESQINTKY